MTKANPVLMAATSAEQPAATRFTSIRRAALFITFWTGFTGLLYEVTWQKYLANLLGSQAKASALILAVFLGGLCAGYLLFGRLSKNASPRWAVRACGWIEIGIGVWAFLFPIFYATVWQFTGVLAPGGLLAALGDITVSMVLIGIPTVLMGGTLPLLTQGLSRDLSDASRFHARVYAVNTFGAFGGCLISGFFLLPKFGLTGTMLLGAPINLLAGALLLAGGTNLPKETPDVAAPAAPGAPAPAGKLPLRAALVVAGIAGFCSLSLQVVFMRVVGLTIGSSEYAFSMVVAAFILMLAAGAWLIAGRERWVLPVWVNQGIAFSAAAALYLTISDWAYWGHAIRTLFTHSWPSFYLYHLTVFAVLCAVLAIPVGAMGSTVPLLFGSVRASFEELGVNVGKLYSLNTIGCVIGALIGGYWLLYFLDLDDIYRIALMLIAISAALSFPWSAAWRKRKLAVLVAAPALAIMAVLPLRLEDWNRSRLNRGSFRTTKPLPYSYLGPDAFFSVDSSAMRMIAVDDDPNTSVDISQRSADEEDKKLNGADYVRNIRVNGKSDGETSMTDMTTMRMTSHLPMLLNRNPVKSVGVIGFGLGVSLGTASLYPETNDIHCMEISPVIKELAHYFDFANHGVTKNPKIRWTIGDAYRTLGSSEDRYSVIISEPSNPWVTGVERVFSEEFYRLVKSRLERGGLYAQWMHSYSMSERTFGIVMKTFGENFPNVRLFEFGSDLILLGSETPIDSVSLVQAQARWESLPEVRKSAAGVGVPSIEALLAHEVPLPTNLYRLMPRHTLEFPRLAYAAGKDFFQSESFNVVTILDRRAYRPWARRAATRLLIGEWLGKQADQGAVLKKYAETVCEIPEAKFFRGWESSNLLCRQSLTALALVGVIPPREETYGIEEPDFELLKALIQAPGDEMDERFWEQLGASIPIEDAGSMARLFMEYDNPYAPLSVRKLTFALFRCLTGESMEALHCRSRFIEALGLTGHGKFASAAHADFEREGGKRLPRTLLLPLERLVSSALEAEEAITPERQ